MLERYYTTASMLPTHHKKRNMVLDSMRIGGGRCPPLIVTVLMLACFLLIFNWWSLSTENIELMNQLDHLQDQLKITVNERDKCFAARNDIEKQYRDSEGEVGLLHVRLQKQNDLKKHNEELTENAMMCQSKLDSLNKLDVTKTATLEALRLEKDRLMSQMDAKREETRGLIAELNKTKSDMDHLKKTCNKSSDMGKNKDKGYVDDKEASNLAGDAGEVDDDEKDSLGNPKDIMAGGNIDEHTSTKSVKSHSSDPNFGL